MLALVGLLWLSERFDWFMLGRHKGWAVLTAIAALAVLLSILILWFVAALLFHGISIRCPLPFADNADRGLTGWMDEGQDTRGQGAT